MIQTEFPVDTEVLRSRIIETARSMNTQRLNVNKSGNVSARCRAEGGALAFLITPSGVPYDDLTPEDISRVTRLPTGEWRDEGPLLPSSEWRLHAAVYESKPEVRAIVHTHSPKATAVSCLESGIPPFHYMVAMSGAAEIPCAPYATFGTEALAESVTGALRHCRVCRGPLRLPWRQRISPRCISIFCSSGTSGCSPRMRWRGCWSASEHTASRGGKRDGSGV